MLRRSVHIRQLSQLTRRQREEALRNARPLVPTALADRFARPLPGRKRIMLASAFAVSALTFYLLNSETVAQTGRRRFKFLSSRFLAYVYADEYDKVVRLMQDRGQWFLPDHDARVVIVRRVMERLLPFSGTDEELRWRIHVIEGPESIANAFILPGGNVFVHSFLINACYSEDALAAVLGHELAHAAVEHQAEDASAIWAGTLTAGFLFFAAGAIPGLALFLLWGAGGGYYLGDFLLRLPRSRKHEAEADYVGLMMMAEACYDPRAAIGFWELMETLRSYTKVDAVPELLSTHPTHENRLKNIKEWLPEAMQRRHQNGCDNLSVFHRVVESMTSSSKRRRTL
ncbi:hypothetical protein L249_5121 [Ophiocordyceps polyrhachis-furcata BCC 54312]|uniref:Peptidase M48 domain-containing protein n=1 Tax=Ophiocordyceps polyrhachis-furcata BCC 54312 TaxID=1330021 RepID=A0A367L3S7_9HYPO|nr:hypothetical protein L249_5121 [Ophiocordyceps polyrhachis-furcata BCC 54312]